MAMEENKNTYFENIKQAFSTLKKGLELTMGHAKGDHKKAGTLDPVWNENYFKPGDEPFTLKYPYEQFEIPDNGRYKLHNEVEDCIVCDKCAKVCPVDCIDIEPIRSPEVFGYTSDGTPKRIYAAKFDIDMAKCCFCGLCTTVCPTECLTMTPEYDFSEFDFNDHNVSFGNMTPLEILEKKKAWEEYQAQKSAEAPKATTPQSNPETKETSSPQSEAQPKAFKPKMKSMAPKPATAESGEEPKSAKPVFRPKIKTAQSKEEDSALQAPPENAEIEKKVTARPVFKPKMPVIKQSTASEPEASEKKPLEAEPEATSAVEPAKPRPVFRPKIKPPATKQGGDTE